MQTHNLSLPQSDPRSLTLPHSLMLFLLFLPMLPIFSLRHSISVMLNEARIALSSESLSVYLPHTEPCSLSTFHNWFAAWGFGGGEGVGGKRRMSQRLCNVD